MTGDMTGDMTGASTGDMSGGTGEERRVMVLVGAEVEGGTL